MKRAIFITAILLLSILFFQTACKKENTQVDYNPVVNSSKDLIFVEDIYTEIFALFHKATSNDSILNGWYKFIDNCDVIYRNEDREMYFGYGSVNRYCDDGKFRKNSYIATFNGPPDADGTVAVIAFDSLCINDDLVGGSVEITRQGSVNGSTMEWTVKVIQGSVEKTSLEDTVLIVYDADYVFSLVEGASTPEDFEDDLFNISGTTDGLSADQYSFSSEITDPLNMRLDCYWIINGHHEISAEGSETGPGTIDYISEDQCNYRVDFYFDDNLFYDYLFH